MTDTRARTPVRIAAASLLVTSALVAAACGGAPAAGDGPTEREAGLTRAAPSLDALLACHDSVVGGDALRSVERVRYRIGIREPGFDLEGEYVATRDGTARIDVHAGEDRVFSEGWDGERGWQLPAGATDTVGISADAAAPLRHGLEQPGHLWTLADMRANGHALGYESDSVSADGTVELRLTLADGFTNWYTVDTRSCRTIAHRNFRAFHPDLDSTRTWVETRYSDFFREDGILRARTTRNVDLVTGDTLGITTLLEVEVGGAAGGG